MSSGSKRQSVEDQTRDGLQFNKRQKLEAKTRDGPRFNICFQNPCSILVSGSSQSGETYHQGRQRV